MTSEKMIDVYEKEQRVLMFSYTGLLELLKYQREELNQKMYDLVCANIYWNAYIEALRQQINKDLDELLVKESELKK